jgi:hypothetical protein
MRTKLFLYLQDLKKLLNYLIHACHILSHRKIILAPTPNKNDVMYELPLFFFKSYQGGGSQTRGRDPFEGGKLLKRVAKY